MSKKRSTKTKTSRTKTSEPTYYTAVMMKKSRTSKKATRKAKRNFFFEVAPSKSSDALQALAMAGIEFIAHHPDGPKLLIRKHRTA